MIRCVHIFFVLFLSMPGIVDTASADIAALEREALIALYSNTGGDHWTSNHKWKEPPLHSDGFAIPGSECLGWKGIGCSQDLLYLIDLTENELKGTLPPEIGDLTDLIYLFLYKNQLTGAIPAEVGNLTDLEDLHLAENQLSGNIPAALGNLKNLKYLDLSENQLDGNIPEQLENLTQLDNLHLDNNQLTGSIPAGLGDLTDLTYLHLEENRLTGSIPAELGNLIDLEYLNLSGNDLSGAIPAEITNLARLNYLNLCNNNLYTDDEAVRDFLTGLQPGWEACQAFPSDGTEALIVNINPGAVVSAGAQWRIDGGPWHDSGDMETGLDAGTYTVEFKAVSGWAVPDNQSVTIAEGENTTISVTYSSEGEGSGSGGGCFFSAILENYI